MSEVWKVVVECWSRKTQLAKAERCFMTALVEAGDSEEAMSEGKNFVESQAPSDVLWVEFTAAQADRIQLPMLTS